jgi:hypothetical protein
MFESEICDIYEKISYCSLKCSEEPEVCSICKYRVSNDKILQLLKHHNQEMLTLLRKLVGIYKKSEDE